MNSNLLRQKNQTTTLRLDYDPAIRSITTYGKNLKINISCVYTDFEFVKFYIKNVITHKFCFFVIARAVRLQMLSCCYQDCKKIKTIFITRLKMITYVNLKSEEYGQSFAEHQFPFD